MSRATYEVGIDLDNDGFVCWGVEASDAANLIPTPVMLTVLSYGAYNSTGVTVDRRSEETDYGIFTLRCVTDTDVDGGAMLGRDADGNDRIEVSASTEYSLGVWVRGVAGSNGTAMKFRIFDQGDNQLHTADFTLTESWQRLTGTFTTGVGDTHVYAVVFKDNDADAISFDLAGLMLVAGDTLPDVFNSGSGDCHLDEVTSYVTGRMTWGNGMGDSYDEFAKPARLNAALSNISGDFTPEDSGATYYGKIRTGMMVKVRASFGGVTYRLYSGYITSFRMMPGVYGAKTVQLEAEDPMLQLLKADYIAELQQNVRTDAVLENVFSRVLLPLPHPVNYWIMGVAGRSELGETTVLLGGTEFIDLETGATTFNYVGDVVGKGGNAQSFLREVVAGEAGGRFWYDTRTATFKFQSRQHDVNLASSTTLTAADFEAAASDYVTNEKPRNKVTVNYRPREVGTPGTVLWKAKDVPITLNPGETRTFTVNYTVPGTDAKVGALDYIQPQPGADYTATFPNGKGDQANALAVSVEFGGATSKISVSNTRSRGKRVVTLLQLRGTPLQSFDRDSVSAQDGASIALYGFYEDGVNVPSIDNIDFALAYANNLVSQFAVPLARYRTVQFIANKADGRMVDGLGLTIGDVITVQDSNFSHDAIYVIVGEQHTVQVGGDNPHTVKWMLKPGDNSIYWIMGDAEYSVLGETTKLAF